MLAEQIANHLLGLEIPNPTTEGSRSKQVGKYDLIVVTLLNLIHS